MLLNIEAFMPTDVFAFGRGIDLVCTCMPPSNSPFTTPSTVSRLWSRFRFLMLANSDRGSDFFSWQTLIEVQTGSFVRPRVTDTFEPTIIILPLYDSHNLVKPSPHLGLFNLYCILTDSRLNPRWPAFSVFDRRQSQLLFDLLLRSPPCCCSNCFYCWLMAFDRFPELWSWFPIGEGPLASTSLWNQELPTRFRSCLLTHALRGKE